MISMSRWENRPFPPAHISYVGIPLAKSISIPHLFKNYSFLKKILDSRTALCYIGNVFSVTLIIAQLLTYSAIAQGL